MALNSAFFHVCLFPLLALTGAFEEEQEWAAFMDDEALSFMQSHTSMKSGPHKLLSDAALGATVGIPQGAFDSVAFAQTVVHVNSQEEQEQEPEVKETPEAPAWLAGQEEAAEEMTCSLEGLSPGVCAMAALARPAPAGAEASDLDYVNPDRLERALFKEIETVLAGTHDNFSATQLQEVEEEISGFFAALPKNDAGRLEHATVRYAVHQRFLRKHAWYLRSLNPVGEAQTPASPGEALRGRVPEHLQRLIEQRENGQGLTLRHLAALVATLDHLIQGDLMERLKAAYTAHQVAASSEVARSDVSEVLQTYMAHFLSLEHKSGYAVTPEQARQERKAIETGYAAWSDVVKMVTEAVAKRVPEHPEAALPFSEVLAAAGEVMQKFEAVSMQDCVDIKRDLTAMPNGPKGSVLLADLHRKALDGSMLFAESSEYLATLGALEEGPKGIGVLVPNYVYSPSNCLGTTSFFDMCCPNECELVLQQLETKLRNPLASPAEVVSVLDASRPEPLSDAALHDLDSVAHAHSGHVPLHGYDFAAWLHRAFPTECPKPRREDFSGPGGDAEVPASAHEFQDVAALPFMVASRSDLVEELEELVIEPAAANGGNATAPLGGEGLDLEHIKAIAAQKVAAGGLKLAPLRDGTSFAQAEANVRTHEEATKEQDSEGSSGLMRRMV